MDLYKLSVIKEICDKFGFSFSKNFGQNFLTDRNILEKIVEVSEVDKDYGVIEIGPGFGVLTKFLLEKAGKVVSIEIDTRLKDLLKESLGEFTNIEVVFQDFLTVDLKKIVEELKQTYSKVCIIANLPYYITSDILEHIICSQASLSSIHAMVQKEVALKLTDTQYHSPLTFMIESIGTISLDMHVSRNVFSPAPRVDSAIIAIHIHKEYNILLTHLLKQAFTQKRKTIYNNLKVIFGTNTKYILEQCQIKENKRPEELKIEDYLKLTKYL